MSEQQKAPSDAPKRALNEIRHTENVQGPPNRSMPEAVAKHYVQDGNAFRSAYNREKIEFIDRGSRMHAYNPVSAFTARTMAETAEARGWKSLEVSGNAKFQQAMYVEATSRNIDVRGYTPTEKDAEILQRREDRKTAVDNPVVKAFLAADTKKAQAAATKDHPQLKQAFAAYAEASALADAKIDSKKAAQAFKDRAKDNIVLSLHRGQEIKMQQPEGARQATSTPPQDHDRSR